jgi:molybdopterin-containing oxidoreductase family iron-sulfur binding subunit
MRGVIEKCTYCVQRLEAAKIKQKQAQRDSKNFRVPTDSVKVACQQACSADAIIFGDLADEKSSVTKAKVNPRNYELLKYIGTRPRTSYLARLRNPNKEMPGADKIAAWSAHQN